MFMNSSYVIVIVIVKCQRAKTILSILLCAVNEALGPPGPRTGVLLESILACLSWTHNRQLQSDAEILQFNSFQGQCFQIEKYYVCVDIVVMQIESPAFL